MNLLTTKEAAEKLGVSVSRIQKMIWAEQLPAQKLGRDYFINEADLKRVEDRKPGRPRKSTSDKAKESDSKKKSRK